MDPVDYWVGTGSSRTKLSKYSYKDSYDSQFIIWIVSPKHGYRGSQHATALCTVCKKFVKHYYDELEKHRHN